MSLSFSSLRFLGLVGALASGLMFSQLYCRPAFAGNVAEPSATEPSHRQAKAEAASTTAAKPVAVVPPSSKVVSTGSGKTGQEAAPAKQKTTASDKDTASKPQADAIKKRRQSLTFQSLAQMNELLESDMPSLALSLLETEQKKRPQFSPDWYAFEYKRIMLMSALEQWQAIIERTTWLFNTAQPGRQITPKIRLWFETQQAMARLQLKQTDRALIQLQQLIWQSANSKRSPRLLPLWRQLLIRAYLQKHYDDDARRALLKYSQDYPGSDGNIDWLLLQAQVFMRTGRPEMAVSLLENVEADDAQALMWLARLQAHPDEAEAIYRRMREKLDGQLLSRGARWVYAYVAWQAAVVRHDLPAQISNLEDLLSLRLDFDPLGDTYRVNADMLWALYNRLGKSVANEYTLLFGSEEQWRRLNKKLLKSSPEQALALNAALALHVNDRKLLAELHGIIAGLLLQRRNGLELIHKLYLHSSKIDDIRVLPEELRYKLVDYAISRADYEAAVRVMHSLEEPPEGKTLFDWRMRKARLLILQGEYAQSEKLIRKTFAEKKTINLDELDRFIQVVFDFQTVQQHQRALRLFDLISMQGLDAKLRRELYFWKAESYTALKQHDYAAMYYLKSANALPGEEYDLWAQSARFKAAQALMQAGIYVDAERVLQELLKVTTSESRKVLIGQMLQKIQLLKTVTNEQ
ncbi:MAG TPA: hypothetical protein ENJ11_04060 [Gammaproteobacteria bacterium]|nr:hypothetical protein [Gammaproteobacteria bacterium]